MLLEPSDEMSVAMPPRLFWRKVVEGALNPYLEPLDVLDRLLEVEGVEEKESGA